MKKIRALPGPDNWVQALFTMESIGKTARDADDWPFAEWVGRQMVDHDQHYAGGHYALGLVAEHRGDVSTRSSGMIAAARALEQSRLESARAFTHSRARAEFRRTLTPLRSAHERFDFLKFLLAHPAEYQCFHAQKRLQCRHGTAQSKTHIFVS